MQARLQAQRRKGFQINAQFIFIDQNPAHTEFLKAEIELSSFKDMLGTTIQILTDDFNQRVDDLIRMVFLFWINTDGAKWHSGPCVGYCPLSEKQRSS